MRQKFCRVCRGWHDPENWPDNCRIADWTASSDYPAPMLINDTMEPTQSMVDGKFYTSKAKMRATYKPSGNREGKRYTEVGDDPSIMSPKPRPKTKPDRAAIKASVGRAFSQAGLGA